jgi:hypothetical protein
MGDFELVILFHRRECNPSLKLFKTSAKKLFSARWRYNTEQAHVLYPLSKPHTYILDVYVMSNAAGCKTNFQFVLK